MGSNFVGRIEKTVFISYRRKHVAWALAIYQYLFHHGYDVFFDYKSIGPGDFGRVITENINARAHFLVLLAPSSLEGCERKEDWLRKEIELAIEYKRNIVPIMLEGFDFGAPETKKYLTDGLETLNQYNGLTLPAEYFDAGMERLCDKFLTVQLSEVLIPVSPRVQKVVKAQQKIAAAEEPVSKNTLTAWDWFERAYQANEPEEQIRLYSKAIALNENFADAYNNLGFSYAKLKQYKRAIAEYDKAIRLNPKDAVAYNNRGANYADLNQHERAITDFDEAIQIDPQYATAYYNRGNSYANLDQHERAIADYDEAIRLDPQHATAYNGRGICYRNLQQYGKAIADYNEAIRLDPQYATAYNNRGNSYFHLKQYERAIVDYDEAIRLDPKDATAYYNRGYSYDELKQYERAIGDYDEAIRLDPKDATAYYNRGTSYDELKQYERAIADYDEAIRINPNYASAYYNKACAFALQEKIEESVQWLREALVREKEKYCELAKSDSDLDAIRDEPAFQQLMVEFCDC
jgi:tetratricopeptide (TPR) repeat protein